MDYQSRPETIILNDPNNIPAGLQDVFYSGKGFNDSFYSGAQGVQTDARLFHFGENDGGADIGLTGADNGTIFYIKGNLWLHSSGARTLSLPDAENVQVTIVVEGNFYISDDLNYGETSAGSGVLTDSGILFITMSDTNNPNKESFQDENKNYVYDPVDPGPDGTLGTGDDIPAEPILNDQGTIGTYDGLYTEGAGNVYFGDAYYGTGGVTHGFMYAQNNAYLTEPPTNSHLNSDYEKIYGVYGFLSAGGVLDLGTRASGEFYRNYKVKYNPALHDGSINIPGVPAGSGTGYKDLQVIAWQVIPNGAP